MKIGEVVSYNNTKAWGFIRELGVRNADFFFHVNAVEGRIRLQVGDTVLFESIPSKTKPDRQEAVNISLAKRADAPVTGVRS
jgi:cold shock CspA family protein